MGAFGLRVFVFDELFTADQTLRGQARRVREAAGDLTVPTGGLPPEAQSVLSGLSALRGRLNRAADALTEAASTLGQIGAAAQRADSGNWLGQMGTSLRGVVLPPSETGPLGPYPWVFGRVVFVNNAVGTALRYRYGYSWVKGGNHWRVNGSGPRLHPQLRTLADRASKAGRVAGPLATGLNTLNSRLRTGGSAPRVAAGTVAESATALGCATAGAKAGASLPIPHPGLRVGAAVAGGVGGGVICSPVGKWAGDRAGDGADLVVKGAGKVVDGAGKVVDGAGKVVDGAGKVAGGIAKGVTSIGRLGR